MIERMNKYSFVVLASKRDEFLARLQELGLVDVTTTGWEPSDDQRRQMAIIENYSEAVRTLHSMLATEGFTPGRAYENGDEAYDHYTAVNNAVADARAEIAKYEKIALETRPWGEFDAVKIKQLSNQGVVLHFFTAQSSEFARHIDSWGERYNVQTVSDVDGISRFVVITGRDEDVQIDAQEIKPLTMTATEADAKITELSDEIHSWDGVWADCAASVDKIAAVRDELVAQLAFSKVSGMGQNQAEGSLVVMEAWAEEARSAEVDAMLDKEASVVYLKEQPTPEDNTPVKLKNNRFAHLFELIGSMYALPKYGTVDLTPFFAPFYMLFFAICLNDAGYGAIIFLLGLGLLLKGGKSMHQASLLTMLCGGATVLFGLYTGSIFGMSVPEMMGYEDISKSPFLDFQGQFFSIALALGVFQILIGMFINICMRTRIFGIRYALGNIGWFMLIVAGCLAAGLPMLNESWAIPGFSTSSVAFYVVCGISLVLMLLFNSPGKNVFVNFGAGLWNTYNNITSLLSDVLSYIRLFAIGLSGGVLALVFNRLALGLTGLDQGLGDGSVVAFVAKIIGATIILLIGHGINLFMSSISSFVHPMRLTFVEFYKNAGFEMTTRTFEPFKKENK